MKLTYLVSRQSKAALCIRAQAGTVTGRFGGRRVFGTTFDPELVHADKIALWKSIFGQEVERLEQCVGEGTWCPPWRNDAGVYYAGWQLWAIDSVYVEADLWRPWPPSDLELLALASKNYGQPATPPLVLGAREP